MDKVWIVTEGSYDDDDSYYDREIAIVCNSRELAEEFLHVKRKSWRTFHIKEMVVQTSADSFAPTWAVEDRTALGRGLTATWVQYFDHEIGKVWEVDDYKTREKWPAVIVRGKDEWDAIEKAAEKFAQFKAEKAGIA